MKLEYLETADLTTKNIKRVLFRLKGIDSTWQNETAAINGDH